MKCGDKAHQQPYQKAAKPYYGQNVHEQRHNKEEHPARVFGICYEVSKYGPRGLTERGRLNEQ